MHNDLEHKDGSTDGSVWDSIGFYLKDKAYFLNLYKRSHKLSAAIFLVSNSIEDDETLKSKIKELCVKMLSLVISLKDLSSYIEVQKTLSEIENSSLEVLSLLDIASISGSISVMNADIIKNEFKVLLKGLNDFRESSNLKGKEILGGILLNTKTEDNSSFKEITLNSIPQELYIKDNNITKELGVNNKRHNRKDTRKSLVYDFILKHKDCSIKDIVPNIKGCSEKTIQREIMDLIKENKVIKTGERRWSKYRAL